MIDLTPREDAAASDHRAAMQPLLDDPRVPERFDSATMHTGQDADERWLEEGRDEPVGLRLRVDRTVFRGSSAHQDIWIFENAAFGRVLALDGYVQITERDEFIYHEMMTHVPMFAHGGMRDVLIIGGGDGGALREVLKHAGVRRAVVVEIDRQVIELCRAHFPSLNNGAFSDPRAEIVVADGPAFLRRTSETFDLILVDGPDPVGPGRALFDSRFSELCRARLRPGGILVAQSGVSFLQTPQIKRMVSGMRELFRGVAAFTAPVPSYYGGPIAFAMASDAPQRLAVSEETLASRVAASRIRTRCYTPALHIAAFALPRHLADLLWRSGPRRGALVGVDRPGRADLTCGA